MDWYFLYIYTVIQKILVHTNFVNIFLKNKSRKKERKREQKGFHRRERGILHPARIWNIAGEDRLFET